MIWKKRCFWAVVCPMIYIVILLAAVPFVYGIVVVPDHDGSEIRPVPGVIRMPMASSLVTGIRYW